MVQKHLPLLCLYQANIVKQDWLYLNLASVKMLSMFALFERRESRKGHHVVSQGISIPNLYLTTTPKTLEPFVETPLAAPNWIDVLHVESQRTAHWGFALHTPALHSEESIHPARLR
jgi:hypothetical protein